MSEIYSPPSYQMGASDVTSAKRQLQGLKSGLRSWLKARAKYDAIVAGAAPSKLTEAQRELAAKELPDERYPDEQRLAVQLHTLLSEIFADAELPDPDVKMNPNAAVELAHIALTGAAPGERDATGLIWLWPVAIVVGGGVLVLVTKIRSDADVAKHRETVRCQMAGGCFNWVRAGAIVFLAWFAWEKLGVGKKVQQLGKE